MFFLFFFFFSSRRRHTRLVSDWSSDVCSSDLALDVIDERARRHRRGGSHHYGRSVPCAQGDARENPGNDRHRRGNQQHRRRLPHYRPDAEKVQTERAEQTSSNLLASDTFIEKSYLFAHSLF